MNDLLVIKYLGNHNISGNINNLYQSHKNNSGVMPTNILDEEDSQTIFAYLQNYDCVGKDLIDACNEVAARCSSLTLNLGAVCNSNSILDIDRAKNFDILVTTRSVSDTVKPQKINRAIFENKNLLLDNEYSFIPQQ